MNPAGTISQLLQTDEPTFWHPVCKQEHTNTYRQRTKTLRMVLGSSKSCLMRFWGLTSSLCTSLTLTGKATTSKSCKAPRGLSLLGSLYVLPPNVHPLKSHPFQTNPNCCPLAHLPPVGPYELADVITVMVTTLTQSGLRDKAPTEL